MKYLENNGHHGESLVMGIIGSPSYGGHRRDPLPAFYLTINTIQVVLRILELQQTKYWVNYMTFACWCRGIKDSITTKLLNSHQSNAYTKKWFTWSLVWWNIEHEEQLELFRSSNFEVESRLLDGLYEEFPRTHMIYITLSLCYTCLCLCICSLDSIWNM